MSKISIAIWSFSCKYMQNKPWHGHYFFNLIIWNWFSILLAQQEFRWLNYSAFYNGVGNKSGVWTTTCNQRLFAAGVVGSTFSKWTSKNRPQVIWTVSLMGPLCFEVGNRCFDGDFCKLTFSPAHLILEMFRFPDFCCIQYFSLILVYRKIWNALSWSIVY